MPATNPYPVRLTDTMKLEIARTSKAVNLSFPETLRQAVTFGLPVIEKRLGKKAAK